MSASHSPYLPAVHQHSAYRRPVTQAYQPPASTYDAGRHRRMESAANSMLETVSSLGSMVSLSALLVIGAAVGGLTAATPTSGDSAPAASITYELSH